MPVFGMSGRALTACSTCSPTNRMANCCVFSRAERHQGRHCAAAASASRDACPQPLRRLALAASQGGTRRYQADRRERYQPGRFCGEMCFRISTPALETEARSPFRVTERPSTHIFEPGGSVPGLVLITPTANRSGQDLLWNNLIEEISWVCACSDTNAGAHGTFH